MKRSDILLILGTVVLSVTGYTGVRYDWVGKARFTLDTRDASAEWPEMVRDGQIVHGTALAPVSVVVFSDYQCPACAALHLGLEELARTHRESVRIIYRHLPLKSIHPFATDAAIAAECAAREERFARFSRELFQQQSLIGSVAWTDFARAAGIEQLPAFSACVEKRATVGAVQRDVALAGRLSLDATPTVAVNGVLYPGGVPLSVIAARIADISTAANAR